jgi:hypothetical protein
MNSTQPVAGNYDILSNRHFPPKRQYLSKAVFSGNSGKAPPDPVLIILFEETRNLNSN